MRSTFHVVLWNLSKMDTIEEFIFVLHKEVSPLVRGPKALVLLIWNLDMCPLYTGCPSFRGVL